MDTTDNIEYDVHMLLLSRKTTINENKVIKYNGKIYVCQTPGHHKHIIQEYHDEPLSGHLGEDQTIKTHQTILLVAYNE